MMVRKGAKEKQEKSKEETERRETSETVNKRTRSERSCSESACEKLMEDGSQTSVTEYCYVIMVTSLFSSQLSCTKSSFSPKCTDDSFTGCFVILLFADQVFVFLVSLIK